MTSLELSKSLLQHHDQEDEQIFAIGFEIKRSLSSIFRISNIKFIVVMLLSLLPLFACTLFYELRLQNTLHSLANLPAEFSFYGSYTTYLQLISVDSRERWQLLRVGFFYVLLFPIVELFGMVTTLNLAEVIRNNGETRRGKVVTTIREIVWEETIITIKAPYRTFLFVHPSSVLSFLGLQWIVLTCASFLANTLLLQGICLGLFVALFYKYLHWSASWNMAMVISVLDVESGIAALRMASQYGKQCGRTTGFLLMLHATVCSVFLRLVSVYAGIHYGSAFAVTFVTAILMGLFCVVNMLKWLAFFSYYHICQQQIVDQKAAADDLEAGNKTEKVRGLI